MIPNFIWFAVPAQIDPLRKESVTPMLDGIAQVFQVIMIIALTVIVNETSIKPMKRSNRLTILLCLMAYYFGWILYYMGIVNSIIHLDLCIAPCMAFILFSYARKNVFSLFSACIFMICHVTFGIVNFILTDSRFNDRYLCFNYHVLMFAFVCPFL